MNPFLLGEAPSISLHSNPAAVQARLHLGPAFGYFGLKEAPLELFDAPVGDCNLVDESGLPRFDEGPSVGFLHSLDTSS